MAANNERGKGYKDLFRRAKKPSTTEIESPFKEGDEVYIHTGPRKYYSGIVQRVMPVMMEVLITNGAKRFDVVKCKQSSARILKRSATIRSLDDASPEDGEQSSARQAAITELHEAVVSLEEEHKQRMKEITQMIQRLEMMN